MERVKQEAEAFRKFYDTEFFAELFCKLNVKKKDEKEHLEKVILNAARNFKLFAESKRKKTTAAKMRGEIDAAIKALNQLEKRMPKIFENLRFKINAAETFQKIVKVKYPELTNLAKEVYQQDKIIPKVNLKLLNSLVFALSDTIKTTAKETPTAKNSWKNFAIEQWLTSLSFPLEKILGRPLQQSHYYGGKTGYATKKGKIQDSALLLFILKPINPKATISQLETAIKATRHERLNPELYYYEE